MTIEEARERVAKIAEYAKNDDEKAHGAADNLMLDVLRAIASGDCAQPQALAAEAVKVDDLDFRWWCA